MSKPLIIVESPSKIKTLRKFLGDSFAFESSVGHIRDLPAKKFGIDLENNFEPEYEILEGKEEVIERLKKAAKHASIVYLSSDPDREGEAIAWHIAAILPDGTKYKRVTFNEFTKDVVKEALKQPRDINQKLVDAQQARRLLDRMVGYKISPILQRKIHRGGKTGSLSAGRVQSVALKFVVDREREIEAFTPVEYWNLGSLLSKVANESPFTANLFSVDGKKVEKEESSKKEVFLINTEEKAKAVEKKLKIAKYHVESAEKKEKKRNPVPPFITSTLQQEASRHYGFSSARTMAIAQSLYEGVEIGSEGAEGLITYMRTDSTRIAPEALNQARGAISAFWGADFLPSAPIQYASKKGAQDAHEGIRPTNFNYTPEEIKSHLTMDQFKLYQLIWRRFFASQMNPAVYDTVSYDIGTDQNMVLRATGSVIKYKGFLIVYEEKEDHDDLAPEGSESSLPELVPGTKLHFHNSFATQSFTKPPARYTEASLVKELEKSGIGRPSTYATIMQKILSRSYTTKEKGALRPTELGMIICQMLEDNFPQIINAHFTAEMEDHLDKIAETDTDWHKFIGQFWKEFYPIVQTAEKDAHVPKVLTDKICPTCGGRLQKIWARDRYFYGCENYPECKYTAPLEELTYNKEDYDPNFNWEQKCEKCGSDMVIRQSRYGIFLGCSKYPECKTIVNIPKKGEVTFEHLPKCPAIGCDGQIVQRRSRFGKTFFSCSTFPECNVIANSLEDLETKYQNYQRTPYEGKKGKRGAKSAKETTSKKKTTKTKTKTTKTASTKSEKAATSKKTPKKKASNQPTHKPSAVLRDIIGDEEVSRPEVTKRLWEYIKKHNLQDPENKRRIVPDKKLAKFFGHSEPIDMMKLASYISKHLK